MRSGIVATSLDLSMPCAKQINAACVAGNWFPYVVAAIKHNETPGVTNGSIMQDGTWPGSDYLTLPDGSGPDPNNPAGHGLMQLTSSWPSDWADPYANFLYAIENFLRPAEIYWAMLEEGEALVKCIAAEYNAGRTQALAGHECGNVDLYTVDNYGARALASYKRLLSGEAL